VSGATIIIPPGALGPAPDGEASIVPASTPAPSGTVENDGWFPPVDLTPLADAVRLRAGVSTARLREAAIGAMLTVNGDPALAAWAAGCRAAGAADLAAVRPDDRLAGEPRLVLLYRRAIAAEVKADLIERYRDVDLTAAGQRKVDDLDGSVDELRRDRAHAVRDMLGRTRTCVELI